MRRFRLLPTLMILGTLALVTSVYRGWQGMEYPENVVRDAIARHGRTAAPDPRLVFLALDTASVSIDGQEDGQLLNIKAADAKCARALELMSNGWPWSREIYALIIERLVKAGAAVVALDLNFPTATQNDAPFHAALEAYRGEVLIGANFSAGTQTVGGIVSPSLTRPVETLIPATVPLDDRIGIDNFWPDSDVDDVIRSAQYRMTMGQVTGDFSAQAQKETCLSMAALAMAKAGQPQLVPPGYEHQPFRYAGGPGTFAPHSIFEIFAPDYWRQVYQSGAFFKGKMVIIGGYGNWQHDEHPTPFGTMPGPEIHLHAMNALLHQDFLHECPAWLNLGLLALGGLLPVALMALLGARGSRAKGGMVERVLPAALAGVARTPWFRVVLTLLVNGGWVGAAVLLYNHRGWLVPVAGPLGLFNFNSICAIFHDALSARRESRRVRQTLERYVSRNVVREMLDNSEEFVASLGGALKPATVLFSDIRNFSKASAHRDAHELVMQLNEYLSAMVECVFEYDGTLDKFIGDAVMAVWGNAHTGGAVADACNATRAAEAMRVRLRALNERWAAEGRPPFEIGIALNHGEVVIGNVGSPHRMEYTVIGDAVNTSWRLQELTKELGEDLVFGESVANLVRHEMEVREVSLCTLPKTHALVRVYTLGSEKAADEEELLEAEGEAVLLAQA